MTLERRNPLPVGFYSVDLRNDQIPEFRRWQEGRSAVKVLKTNQDEQFAWILFQVSAPTMWADPKILGFPSIAKVTDEKPEAFEPTPDLVDQIIKTLPGQVATASAITIMTVVGIGLGVYIFRKELFDYGIRKYRSARNR